MFNIEREGEGEAQEEEIEEWDGLMNGCGFGGCLSVIVIAPIINDPGLGKGQVNRPRVS